MGKLASLASLNPASRTTTIPGTASTYPNLFYPTAPPPGATARSKVTTHPGATAGSEVTAQARTTAGSKITAPTTASALS